MEIYKPEKDQSYLDIASVLSERSTCLKRVVNSVEDKNENNKVFNVSDWVNKWQKKDIIDDKDQYGK